ncbi:YbbR-like domain-containing protein [Gaetbulibacter sp. M240]|uniref:YbbR-like domain-containing protein n=1 Tax=Gaetbulibacter sp. M240 TaxID=3126511 RepID=UPI00374FB7E9
MPGRIKSKLRASLKSKKINVFILFLISAFVILLLSKLSKQHTNTLVFGIERLNVPPENVILNDSTRVLSLTLKTHGFKWLKYYLNEPSIKIDFSKDVLKKDSSFIWTRSLSYLKNTQFDSQVQLLEMSPDTLYFKFDVNEVKKVPISVNSDLKFSLGFDLESPLVSNPDSITIVGPKALVDSIYQIPTNDFSLKDVKTDIDQKVGLELPNDDNLKFSHRAVKVQATVGKFTEGTVKVPVNLVNVPDSLDIKYFPKVVVVSYYVSLTEFNNVKAQDFRIECDFNKVAKNQSVLIPELVTTSELVKNAKINQSRIEFIVTE